MLEGYLGNDQIDGLGGNDLIGGGGGNDFLTPGAGNDIVHGGPGSDIARISGLRSDFTILLDNGTATVTSNLTGEVDRFHTVELLRFDNADIRTVPQSLVGTAADMSVVRTFGTYGVVI